MKFAMGTDVFDRVLLEAHADKLVLPDGLFFIYSLVDRDGLKHYIGKAKNLPSRIDQHIGQARRGNSHALYEWMRAALAAEEFGVMVEEVVTADRVLEREEYWIAGLAAIGHPLKNERSVVLPEVGPFKQIAVSIASDPSLAKFYRAVLGATMNRPFSIAHALLLILTATGNLMSEFPVVSLTQSGDSE